MYAMGYYKRQILRPQRQAGMCNPRRGLASRKGVR